ncbi:MAG: GIY-YIG nuclease family protein [Ferruginibacter sp.]
MSYTIYILYSRAHQKHYTGFTSNLAQRLLSHNELGKDWTAKYRLWQLIYTRDSIVKKEDIGYEKWLKTGIGRDFVKTLPHKCIGFKSRFNRDGSSSR